LQLLGVAATSAALTGVAVAQGTPVDSAAICAAAADIVATGEPASEYPRARGIVRGCPGVRGDAYAAAMRRLRHSIDRTELLRVYNVTIPVHDAALFAAAEEVASDATASTEARVAALGSLTNLAGGGDQDLIYAVLPDELDEMVQTGRACMARTLTMRVATDTPLPADADRRADSLAARIAADPGAPAVLRMAGNCLWSAVYQAATQRPIDPTLVKLTYLCDNRFRVRNGNARDVTVTYDVYGTDESGALGLDGRSYNAPYSEYVFKTEHSGTVRLFVGSQLVATKANGQAPCSP
jgi:hypothetical protein